MLRVTTCVKPRRFSRTGNGHDRLRTIDFEEDNAVREENGRDGGASGAPPEAAAPLASRTVWLFAALTGLTVANLYYHQPLLGEMARGFGVPESRAGLISTVTQVGYALGLLLFVPLGDVRERRGLVTAMLIAVAVALAGAALAPSFGWLALASFAVGATTIVPQLLIPFAAGLAGQRERGRVVGLVMGGLLIGVLAARTVSGFLGAAFGWRSVFAAAAALMLLLAVAVRRWLPRNDPAADLGYGELLRSLLRLARTEPLLREAAALGAMAFGAFSAFWTTLVFRLGDPPLHYGARAAGLFGLVGIVGATAAPLVGRLSDRRSPRATVGVGLGILVAAYLLFLAFGGSLAGLVVGVIVLDAGSQAVNVSNQARIYGLPAALHGRLNTVYMVAFFAGGSVGSFLSTWAWGHARWVGVCAVGLGHLAVALLVYARGRRLEG
jgi:predicted MFS family arabinose efflux permease